MKLPQVLFYILLLFVYITYGMQLDNLTLVTHENRNCAKQFKMNVEESFNCSILPPENWEEIFSYSIFNNEHDLSFSALQSIACVNQQCNTIVNQSGFWKSPIFWKKKLGEITKAKQRTISCYTHHNELENWLCLIENKINTCDASSFAGRRYRTIEDIFITIHNHNHPAQIYQKVYNQIFPCQLLYKNTTLRNRAIFLEHCSNYSQLIKEFTFPICLKDGARKQNYCIIGGILAETLTEILIRDQKPLQMYIYSLMANNYNLQGVIETIMFYCSNNENVIDSINLILKNHKPCTVSKMLQSVNMAHVLKFCINEGEVDILTWFCTHPLVQEEKLITSELINDKPYLLDIARHAKEGTLEESEAKRLIKLLIKLGADRSRKYKIGTSEQSVNQYIDVLRETPDHLGGDLDFVIKLRKWLQPR